jgi:GNAT superfamily N-acetyltransferase
MGTGDDSGDERLAAHLRAWLGAWPPEEAVDVVAATVRDQPAWDGRIAPLVGVGMPGRVLLSVAPDRARAVRRALGTRELVDDPAVRRAIVEALGVTGYVMGRGVFRWSTAVAPPAELADIGDWVDPGDPRVPMWLKPFNYPQVLIAWDGDGAYGAGVGIKRHDAIGRELAVVTSERLRGNGVARRLVAQAARRVLDEGSVPTYLHDPDNIASARVADAAGLPDRGWSVYGLFPVSG